MTREIKRILSHQVSKSNSSDKIFATEYRLHQRLSTALLYQNDVQTGYVDGTVDAKDVKIELIKDIVCDIAMALLGEEIYFSINEKEIPKKDTRKLGLYSVRCEEEKEKSSIAEYIGNDKWYVIGDEEQWNTSDFYSIGKKPLKLVQE